MSKTREVSPVSPEEMPVLVDIWENSVRTTHAFLKERDIQDQRLLVETEYLSCVAIACVREKGSIIGFISVDGAQIEMLFVHPDFMSQGVGKALITHALTQMGATQVDVNEQNSAAIGFYEHLGFHAEAKAEEDGLGFPILHMSIAP